MNYDHSQPNKKLVRIKSNGAKGWGTTVTTTDGTKLNNVLRVVIHPIEPSSLLVAEIHMSLIDIDIEAVPMLSLDNARDAASFWGYDLVKRTDPGEDE